MFKTYLHLSDIDVDDEIASKMGIKKRGRPTNSSKALEPLQCGVCFAVCGPTARYCDCCGNPVSEDAIREQQQIKRVITLHPELFVEIVHEEKQSANNL